MTIFAGAVIVFLSLWAAIEYSQIPECALTKPSCEEQNFQFDSSNPSTYINKSGEIQ